MPSKKIRNLVPFIHKKGLRANTSGVKLENGTQFTPDQLVDIASLACEGVPLNIILADYGLSDLSELEGIDREYFEAAYNKGILFATQDAGAALKMQMVSTRGGKGVQACLEYLVRFGKWENDVDVNPGGSEGNRIYVELSN